MQASRRNVLKHLGAAGAGLAVAALPGWAQSASPLAADETVMPFTDMPSDFATRRGDVVTRFDLRELRAPITPNDAYFTVAHYNRPALDSAAWRLESAGLVGQPATLTLADLMKRPRIERTVCFECGGNRAQGIHGLVGNATWTGASLRDVLRDMKPRVEAREVIFWGADRGEETIRGEKYPMHFARSMSMDDAMASGAILAYQMNGSPLPAAHGFPVRLIVPGWYGVNNVKWLTKIELSDTRFMGRFMGRDYVTVMGRQVGDTIEYTETSVARMRVKSVIARVTRAANERIRIFGAAWSDGTPLKAVEIRVDGGPWQPARLESNPNPFAWTFFVGETTLTPGVHTAVSRATDRQGRTQPVDLALKKTNWEDNAQFTRTFEVPRA
jgi:DMSO/TMAO reductase YedYZ molybdopterin-dependent catalytic subunit